MFNPWAVKLINYIFNKYKMPFNNKVLQDNNSIKSF